MTGLVLKEVEIDGQITDVTMSDGTIDDVGPDLEVPPGADVVDGHGGALLPGLWDHHIHLVALAAARRSVRVGPPEVTNVADLASTLLRHRPVDRRTWVRGVGYHESVAGVLDRHDLDRLLPGVPLRIQHRSGALWILSSEAIHRLGIEDDHTDAFERDAHGRITGRLYGGDRWLRERIEAVAPQAPPDLAEVGRQLASYGVVGVTDATPYERVEDLDLLATAASTDAVLQRVIATGGPTVADSAFPASVERGPVKLRLADHDLPSLDELVGWITTAHAAGRPIAVHCVTREALVLTVAAIDDTGSVIGDRIEHGAVIPPDLQDPLRRHRLTVVTQPNFIAERGDVYRTQVDGDDLPHLYPCRSLIEAGIRVAGSTDAPFGHPDPWRAMDAAVRRCAATGRHVGTHEAVDPATALALFLRHADAHSGVHRIVAGARADLCLLAVRRQQALENLSAELVRATVIGGRVAYQARR